MLWALKALEYFAPASLGWTVLLNSDEEIGSPGSLPLLEKLAREHLIGLVFEPSLPNGNFVGERKGSGNFHIIVNGKSAHAGREHHKGRNAIAALSACVQEIDSLTGRWPGATFNVGTIHGGSALNVVPDRAIAGLNVRYARPEDEQDIYQSLQAIATGASAVEGFSCRLEGQFFSPPKPLDNPHKLLLNDFIESGRDLGLDLAHEASGGVCDGNKLTSFGLVNIDTLGVQGGAIHSPYEYCLPDSLPERSALTANFLLKLARQEINPEKRYEN